MLGTGAIELHRADGTLVESFDASTGAHLTASGSTLTINPSADLSFSTGYYLTLASTAVLDPSGNAFAGIADSTTLNFTTLAAAPVAQDDSASGNEDAAVTGTVTATDADTPAASLTYGVADQPAHGTVALNSTGAYTYTPDGDYNGTDSRVGERRRAGGSQHGNHQRHDQRGRRHRRR